MTMIHPGPGAVAGGAAPAVSERGSLASAAALFHGFGDPSRLAILRHLALGERRVAELTAHLGLAQSTVSQHLSCLKACGLVTARSVGRASVYSLAHPEALVELWSAAERLLALTGDAVALCPRQEAAAAAGDRR